MQNPVAVGLFCSSSCLLFVIFLLRWTRVFSFSSTPNSGYLANFQFLDYSILTNKCEGLTYLNDTCASTLFSYINLYGKYPPGLFSSECREGKKGLACPASSPLASAKSTICAPQLLHIAGNALVFPLLIAPSLLTVLWLNMVL